MGMAKTPGVLAPAEDRPKLQREARQSSSPKSSLDRETPKTPVPACSIPVETLSAAICRAVPADKLPPMRPMLESGVLAYHHDERGDIGILVIQTKRSHRWSIPKGRIGPHLSFAENAAKEAYEEAGVRGRISANPVGRFRMAKRTTDRQGKRLVEVWVYLLEVTEQMRHWPEQTKRKTRWLRCDEAADLLREPLLSELCRLIGDARNVTISNAPESTS